MKSIHLLLFVLSATFIQSSPTFHSTSTLIYRRSVGSFGGKVVGNVNREGREFGYEVRQVPDKLHYKSRSFKHRLGNRLRRAGRKLRKGASYVVGAPLAVGRKIKRKGREEKQDFLNAKYHADHRD